MITKNKAESTKMVLLLARREGKQESSTVYQNFFIMVPLLKLQSTFFTFFFLHRISLYKCLYICLLGDSKSNKVDQSNLLKLLLLSRRLQIHVTQFRMLCLGNSSFNEDLSMPIYILANRCAHRANPSQQSLMRLSFYMCLDQWFSAFLML